MGNGRGTRVSNAENGTEDVEVWGVGFWMGFWTTWTAMDVLLGERSDPTEVSAGIGRRSLIQEGT